MTELWLFLKTRIGRFVAAAVAVTIAVLGAFLAGRHKGATHQKNADLATAAQGMVEAANAAVKQTQDAAQARADVEAATAQLPDAPAQKVAGADPATAAGKLRDEGWTRD